MSVCIDEAWCQGQTGGIYGRARALGGEVRGYRYDTVPSYGDIQVLAWCPGAIEDMGAVNEEIVERGGR